jgi:hypothetical protein
MALDPLGAAALASPAPAVGYQFSLTDIAGFDAALARAGQPAASGAGAPAGSSPAVQALMKPFELLSAEAAQISAKASEAASGGATLSPGEMIMLSVRCQEFMFHCQLTSNVANRTSDGLQQLFRQQG